MTPSMFYTLDGRYLCAAECIEAAGFGDSAAGREHARARRRKARAVKEAAYAEQRLNALEAAALLPAAPAESDAADLPPGVVEVDFRRRPAQTAAPAEEKDWACAADDLILAMAAGEAGGGP